VPQPDTANPTGRNKHALLVEIGKETGPGSAPKTDPPGGYYTPPAGGVKSPEGKVIAKYNALKHGLLAKETVITVGDGAENPDAFHALLVDLKGQLSLEAGMNYV
jgi:hypothetical protein